MNLVIIEIVKNENTALCCVHNHAYSGFDEAFEVSTCLTQQN